MVDGWEGHSAGIYASLSWFKTYLSGVNCKKWVASWSKIQPTVDNMVLWQYSSMSRITGIAGNVDCNKNISLAIGANSGSSSNNANNSDSSSDVENDNADSSNSDINEKVSDTKMPTIKKGSRNKAVKIWQLIIGVEVDGKFGPKTDAATKEFQKKNGLEADGIVGPKTWKKGLESV